MITANRYRRCDFAIGHHLVEGETDQIALAQAKPADAGRQALKLDVPARLVEPILDEGVVRQEFTDLLIGLANVLGIARERDPAERALALTEQRPDVGLDKARLVEGVFDAHVIRHLAQIVAVVDHDRAAFLVFEHGPHLPAHRLL